MKQKTRKIVAVLVAFAAMIGAYSYASTMKQTHTWVFIGNQLQDVEDITTSNYQLNPSSLPAGCGTPMALLPCEYDVPTSVDNIDKLEEYLHENFGETALEISNGADTRKP